MMTARNASASACATIVAIWVFFALTGQPAWADYKDDMGYTALRTELGAANMPNGTGIKVSQVEALYYGLYAPNPANGEFTGKTFNLKGSNLGDYSWHAGWVGTYFYGTTSGLAPGVTTIDNYEVADDVTDNNGNVIVHNGAVDYRRGGFLRYGSYSPPRVETSRVQSNSWIASFSDPNLIQRFDGAIARDNFVAVVGLNNGTGNPVPSLMDNSYNAISVGLSNGDHSYGLTTADTPGRMKPDIVASTNGAYANWTSFTVPMVSGTAADLLQVVDASPALTAGGGGTSETIKAILMAGATTTWKNQVRSWGRTHTSPLDPVFGAGQLNVYNSYHILTAGPQPASASATVSPAGWDFSSLSLTAAPKTYFFDVPAGAALKEFSAILTWNRQITPSEGNGWMDTTAYVANFDLKLYSASDYSLGSLVDYSTSTVDNVEHIYGSLLPGRYALQVSNNSTGDDVSTDYALAWRNRPTLPGDVNLDGQVGLLDYNVIKMNFGATNATWDMGDLNADGQVGLLDFNIVKANFGQALSDLGPFLALSPAGGSTPPVNTVPEPVSLALLLAAWPLLRTPRRP
ncbi:MAG: dockerin type I domain-containing protein [Planctomycetota bacterium]|nr:dockerin type I domain-containing protein [Planctomycetota bacterium]